ncbi:MAG: hypothetical protein IJA67_05785 [Oscillospiraceae bacterium]|nr:hypothetical protein [Oscillospiraceae bacterium]
MDNNIKLNWQKILIAVLTALLIFALFRIASLSSEIDSMQNSINNLNSEINFMQNNISSIYDNVDERLKKQSSLLASVETGFGSLNHETHEVTVEMTLIPKTVTDNMELYVTVGDTEYKCERENTNFYASLPVNLFLRYDEHPILTIQSPTGTQTEILEDVRIGSLYHTYLPHIYASLENNADLKNGKLLISGSLHIDYKPTESGVGIETFTLVTEVNGKETDRRDLTGEIEKNTYDEQISMTVDATFNDQVYIYLLSEDSLGYTHKNVVYDLNIKDGPIPEPSAPAEDGIYGKDGKLLNED